MSRNSHSPNKRLADARDLHLAMRSWFGYERFTETQDRQIDGLQIPVYVNEFWTAKQRDGHSLHELSYRACYKPQLPGFFIERLCDPGDRVYDPFMGRGTTLIEAQLRGCIPVGNDANPLSKILAAPRLQPPTLRQVEQHLQAISLDSEEAHDPELHTFFDPATLTELYAWRSYFRNREQQQELDAVDRWIQMVACNRLTGHSPGFFSVYTLPPNQATSVVAQQKINAKRGQIPEYRDTRALILRKSRQLLKDPLPRGYHSQLAEIHCTSADQTPAIPSNSIRLVVTSPPFLDTVDYVQDNWLRNWFCDLSVDRSQIWQLRSLPAWVERMTAVFHELRRVLQPNGWVAFEVGEIRKQKLLLENEVVRAATAAGLIAECILIHSQNFTKTANCWGVANNQAGTNSNRIVLLRKPT